VEKGRPQHPFQCVEAKVARFCFLPTPLGTGTAKARALTKPPVDAHNVTQNRKICGCPQISFAISYRWRICEKRLCIICCGLDFVIGCVPEQTTSTRVASAEEVARALSILSALCVSWPITNFCGSDFRHKSSGLFRGIDFPKAESVQDSASHGPFSVQNLIEASTFDAVAPRKGTLISLPLHRGSQQVNNFVIIKYEQVTA
jgi:hypothetical protein